MKKSANKDTAPSDKNLFRKKIQNVLSVLTDENASEKEKAEVLRTIIEKIIYNKSQKSLEIYFYE